MSDFHIARFICLTFCFLCNLTCAQPTPPPVARSSLVDPTTEYWVVKEAPLPLVGLLGYLGFGTAVLEDPQGKYHLVAVYLNENLRVGDIVSVVRVYVQRRMYYKGVIELVK